MQPRKLIAVRLPIFTVDEKLAPPAIDVYQFIEYGKQLTFSVCEQFQVRGQLVMRPNEYVVEETQGATKLCGKIEKMLDFLTPAPTVLPNDAPLFYAGYLNLNMFNFQYNKMAQQSETTAVNPELKAALEQFFRVRPVVTSNLLFILFTNMKFADVAINGVRIPQCTGNQLKNALYYTAKMQSDHWFANADVVAKNPQSTLLARPRRKNYLIHKEELKYLLENDYTLGWELPNDMKMQLTLLGRGSYFGSALHSDAYADFKLTDYLIYWFCDSFQARAVGPAEDVMVFKTLADVIYSDAVYSFFQQNGIEVEKLDLRVDFLQQRSYEEWEAYL